jgi:hypothetical protein
LRANTNWRKVSIFLNVEDVIRQLEFRKSGSLLFTTAGSDVDATVVYPFDWPSYSRPLLHKLSVAGDPHTKPPEML